MIRRTTAAEIPIDNPTVDAVFATAAPASVSAIVREMGVMAG
jgi:hypothetical protein